MASNTNTQPKKRSKAKIAKKQSFWPWLIGAGVVAAIAVPIILNVMQASNLPGEFFRSQGNTHINLGDKHPDYNSNPPTSGWHTGDLTAWGSYDYIVPDERLIHNMEDGGVILWYTFGIPEQNNDEIAKLEAAVEQAEETSGKRYRHVVIVPREGMPTPYAMTAWTRLQQLETVDQAAISAFLKALEGIDHHVAGGS
jgi:hypothetical protein